MQAATLIDMLQRDAQAAPLLAALTTDPSAEGDWLDWDALARPAVMAPLLARYARVSGHPDGDLRALASLWSRWHFWVSVPPLVASVLLHRSLPDILALRLDAGQQNCGLRLAPAVRRCTAVDDGSVDDGPVDAAALHEALTASAAPLVATLAGLSGASPRVFWNNFGNYVEYVHRQLDGHPRRVAAAATALDELLTRPVLAGGGVNLLYRPVRYLHDAVPPAPDGTRVRRICCLAYLLPDTALCSNCPRLYPPERGSRV